MTLRAWTVSAAFLLFGLSVCRAAPSSDYQGVRDPDHVYRFTPEFYYGLTPRLELGAYLLSALDKGGHAVFDGSKLRLKFILGVHYCPPTMAGHSRTALL